MTTLQLAARMAEAARNPRPGVTPAQSVLGVLYRYNCWLTRIRESKETGLTVERLMPKPRGPKNRPLPFEESHETAPASTSSDDGRRDSLGS